MSILKDKKTQSFVVIAVLCCVAERLIYCFGKGEVIY